LADAWHGSGKEVNPPVVDDSTSGGGFDLKCPRLAGFQVSTEAADSGLAISHTWNGLLRGDFGKLLVVFSDRLLAELAQRRGKEG
jgi:hypothetical protein